MNFKKIISAVKSADAKLENKFNSLSKVSANILVFGQLFILLILSVNLLCVNFLSFESLVLLDIFESVHILIENAALGLFILWSGAIFMDYTEKSNGG